MESVRSDLLSSHPPEPDISNLKKMISIPEMSLPVGRPSREDVPHHGPTVPTARDSKAESGPVIAKFNHLNLSPVTLKLKQVRGNRWDLFSILVFISGEVK